MGDTSRLAWIRSTAIAGVAALVLTGVNLLFLPAAIVGLVVAVAGVRRVGDDLEAASLRLGAAVIAALVVAIGGIVAGSGIVAAPAGVLSFVAFTLSWRACERLRVDRRRAWGVHQSLVMQRDRELSERQRALRDGVFDRPADETDET